MNEGLGELMWACHFVLYLFLRNNGSSMSLPAFGGCCGVFGVDIENSKEVVLTMENSFEGDDLKVERIFEKFYKEEHLNHTKGSL